MRIASLFSGGKDSTYALFWAMHQGWDVRYLVTVRPRREDSYMFQVPCVEITRYSSRALGIPLIEVDTSGRPEEELLPLMDALTGLDIDGIVSGALRSEYQRRRLDAICDEMGIRSFAPLWHTAPVKLLWEMIDQGYEMLIGSVAAMGLGPDWIGRKLDMDALSEILRMCSSYGINPDGEGGDFETLVLYAPGFRKRIEITDYDVCWRLHSGYMIIRDARLTEPHIDADCAISSVPFSSTQRSL